MVIRALVKHNLQKNKLKNNKTPVTMMDVFRSVVPICGIMLFFGLTWTVAGFTFVLQSRDIFPIWQILFAFLNGLQGFWIYFFFVVINSEARGLWNDLLFFCKKKPPAKTNIPLKKKYFTLTRSRPVKVDCEDIPKDSANAQKTSNSNTYDEERSCPAAKGVKNDSSAGQATDELSTGNEELNKNSKGGGDIYVVKQHSTKVCREHEVEQVELEFL